MKVTKQEHAEALAKLREWIKPGDTVYTILRHVSSSGMSREIGVVLLKCEANGRATDLHPNYSVSKVTGYRQGKRDGLVVGGCGMDMGFALVYDLSRRLFPDGFGIEGEHEVTRNKARPKTREEAAQMVAHGFKFRGRNGDTTGWDDDGGYALTHRWL